MKERLYVITKCRISYFSKIKKDYGPTASCACSNGTIKTNSAVDLDANSLDAIDIATSMEE